MNRSRLPILLLAAAALACLANPAASARGNVGSTYGGMLYRRARARGARHPRSDAEDDVLRGRGLPDVLRAALRLRRKAHVYPELAAALPTISKDKLTYTIPLRQGIVFNDGTPFNAQAVVTLAPAEAHAPRLVARQRPRPDRQRHRAGPYTVVIHSKRRSRRCSTTLATPRRSSCRRRSSRSSATNFGTDPVCVGPFMFDHRVVGDSVTVIKSPYYYNRGAVHLDKIVFKPCATRRLRPRR